jgi:hypothetical protein
MKMLFRQATHIEGHNFEYGKTYDVPEKVLNSAYFQKLIQSNLVVDADASKEISAETFQERQARLAEKLSKRHAPAAEVAAVVTEDLPVEPWEEDDKKEVAPKKSKNKG